MSSYPNPYNTRRPAPAAPATAPARNNTPFILAGAGALVALLVVGFIIIRLVSKPRARGPVGSVPANFFQQAAADFNESRRLLLAGQLAESAEKFDESQLYRSRAGNEPTVPGGQTFEAWCAAKEKEYRTAAASFAQSLAQKVGPDGPSVAEVDTFLERFGSAAAKADWQAQRAALATRVATGLADGAYRIHWVIEGDSGQPTEDMNDDERRPLADAVAKRIGHPAPLVPQTATPDVPPEQGLGFVRVELVFTEAPYRSQRTGKEFEIKVPAILTATITVISNKAPSAWDGEHRYTARVEPPKQLTNNDISATRARLQVALLNQVVEKINGAPSATANDPDATPPAPRRRPANADPESLPPLRRPQR